MPVRPFLTAALAAAALTAVVVPTASATGVPVPTDPPTPTRRPTASPTHASTPTSSSTPTPTVAPHPVGLGVKVDWGPVRNPKSGVSAYAAGLSGTSTFIEVEWCDLVNADGSYRREPIDEAGARARQLGLTLMVKIRTGTCRASTGTGDTSPARGGKTPSVVPKDMTAYEAFVGTLVAQAKTYGVREYAIENEVNAPQFWPGSAAAYADFARRAAAAVHRADPEAVVVDPGLSSVALGIAMTSWLVEHQPDRAVAAYSAYFARRFGTRGYLREVSSLDALKQVLAQEQNVRNVQFDQAVQQLYADGTFAVRQVHYYEAPEAADEAWHHIERTTPPGMPIEVWELGLFKGRAASASEAADLVRTTSAMLAGRSRGPRMTLWLPIQAPAEGSRNEDEPRVPLLDRDGVERDTARAHRRMSDDAREAMAAPVTAAGLDGVRLTRGGQVVTYAWPTRGERSVVGGRAVDAVTGQQATRASAAHPVRIEGDVRLEDVLR